MEDTQQEGADGIVSVGSTETLDILTFDSKEKPADMEELKEQHVSAEEGRIVPPDGLHDVTTTGPSRVTAGESGSLGVGQGHSTMYAYASRGQTVYYGGYENTTREWEEYPNYINSEGREIGFQGAYENPPFLLHPGYGYSPQMPYGPYAAVSPPLPSVSGEGQLYCPLQTPLMARYYQQPVPPSMPYITYPAPMSQAELSMPARINQHGTVLADPPNSNGVQFGPQPGYPLPYGSFNKRNFDGSFADPSFSAPWNGIDGLGFGGPWSDWSKSSEGQRSLTPLPSPVASRQLIGTMGSFGHNGTPLASGMASMQQRLLHGFGSMTISNDRGFTHDGLFQPGMNFGASESGSGLNDRSWIAIDKVRQRGRGTGSLCSCNSMLDILTEQSKGPRASRTKYSTSEHNLSADNKGASAKMDRELYNRSDFVSEYSDAKFFIIKSYSEDNVHKSIKYGVWASTSGGNRKLDAAYRESREKEACPVFLLFSVNTSGQFCGVAEMVGPVDFNKSVDYWQQDKWTGQFVVKWHFIKDIPNSEFRHIILENNENKPVTNSRDTQEVGLEQGLEILNIFNNYETEISILDDFDFYEDRQKALQEMKARRQVRPMPITRVATSNEHWNPVPVSGNQINHLSKSFVEAVRFEDSGKTDPTIEKVGSNATPVPTGVSTVDPAMTTMAAPVQGS